MASQLLQVEQVYGWDGSQPDGIENQTNLPLMGKDQSTSQTTLQNPIRVFATEDNYSFERFFRLKVTDMGTQTQLQNFRVWQTPSAQPSEHCELRYGCVNVYDRKPVDTESVVQQVQIPTSEASVTVQNLKIQDKTDPAEGQKLSQVNDVTDYGVLQLKVGQQQTQGGSQVIHIAYDEVQ